MCWSGAPLTEFNQNRLGSSQAVHGRLPTKTAGDVAAALVKAAEREAEARHSEAASTALVLAGGVILAPG